MGPTLTSKSFHVTTTTTNRHLPSGGRRHHRLTVSAKKGGAPIYPNFGLGKTADTSPPDSSDDTTSSSPFKFKFDFGNVADIKSLVPVVSKTSSSFGNSRRKDPGTVFVAGASGQAGIRIAQKLLREGFIVRAGVPELAAAQELARLAATYKFISKEELKRLNAVESAYKDAESIAKAIGNASKVVVTVGPEEYNAATEVTASDALQVVQAAKLAGVSHVAIVYDSNAGPTSTYNVLDGISTFFSNLFSRTQPLSIAEFLQKIVEADISYTLIKTSLTEDYSPESSYGVVLASEGSANDYKVSKSQIATLVADVFSNTAVAENKVVEVYADPSAPLKSTAELFSAIPEDGRRKAYAEAVAKAKEEEEALLAAEKAREAVETAKKLEEQVKKKISAVANKEEEDAPETAGGGGVSMESIFSKAKGFSSGLSFEKLGSQIRIAVQQPPSVDDDDEELPKKKKVQIATVRGQAKARSLEPKKAVVKPPTLPAFPKPNFSFNNMMMKKEVEEPQSSRRQQKPTKKAAREEPVKTEVRKVFGGLFQQETIYVDE